MATLSGGGLPDDDAVAHGPLTAREGAPALEVLPVEERGPLVASEVADARAAELVGLPLLAVVLDRDVAREVHRVAQVGGLDAVHPDLGVITHAEDAIGVPLRAIKGL